MSPARRTDASNPLEPELLLNRELSWLAWNSRVPALASEPTLPLLERVRFCAIFSSHLDEFFMVRVAGLMDQAAAGVAVISPDGRAPEQALNDIRERVLELSARQAKLWKRELRPALADAGIIVAQIAERDVLVHHPYHSFKTSFEAFVRGAARDEDTVGLKATVYRTSGDSPVVPALVEAPEAGKQAVCLIELKARFDESRNLEWARALEEAGVHVVHGFPNWKIHAKTTLVIRREGNELRRYAHLGTGNYHATTARAYEDFGLFTADPAITADVADLFNYLTGFSRPTRFRKLLVAPFDLRDRLIQKIRRTSEAAAAGEE